MVNRVLKFTWEEWKWLAVIVMLGLVMYWTALVVQPTFDLIEQNTEILEQGSDRVKDAENNVQIILDNQNNNTERIEALLHQHVQIETRQILLLETISNASSKLSEIGDVLLLEEHNVNQTLVDMLIEKEMRKWIAELKRNLTSNLS